MKTLSSEGVGQRQVGPSKGRVILKQQMGLSDSCMGRGGWGPLPGCIKKRDSSAKAEMSSRPLGRERGLPVACLEPQASPVTWAAGGGLWEAGFQAGGACLFT